MSEIALPLLAKELTELAARRRTYVVRVIYAALLLCVCWLAFRVTTMRRGSLLGVDYLGTGSLMLWWIGYLQNIGMLLVMPALACDVLTREKERQTIGLLLLTRLGPWTIILEKFLSRLFPAVCLLLISLPLLGFSYSLGGVEAWQIVNSAMGLLTNAIVLTAIAVACSAICHTTTAAFLWTYALIVASPLMVVSSGSGGDPFDFVLFGNFFSRAIIQNPRNVDVITYASNFRVDSTLPAFRLYLAILTSCVPPLVYSVVLLGLARVFLISRAFKAGGTRRWWSVIRQGRHSASGAVAMAGDFPVRLGDVDLLHDQPIAWRQTQKFWFSRPAIRLASLVVVQNFLLFSILCGLPYHQSNNASADQLVIVVLPLLLIAVALAVYVYRLVVLKRVWTPAMGLWIGVLLSLQSILTLWICLNYIHSGSHHAQNVNILSSKFLTESLSMWVIMLLLLITGTAGLITQERAKETLFVLLTTPLTGREIVRQKLMGIQKLVALCIVPMATCLVFRMLLAMPKVHRQSAGQVDYPLAFLNEATMLLIYPQCAIWAALYFSLRSKTTIAAIMKTILSIVGMCIVPWLILFLFAAIFGGFSEDYFGLITVVLMFGPADLLLYGYGTDCIPPGFDDALWPLVLNCLIHGGLWWWLRKQCLERADRLLGRVESSGRPLKVLEDAV